MADSYPLLDHAAVQQYTSHNDSKTQQLYSNIDNHNVSDQSMSPSPLNTLNAENKPPVAGAPRYTRNRARNNEAAKVSRRNRRLREAETALRAAHLEQENIMLKAEINTLTAEIAALRQMAMASSLLPPQPYDEAAGQYATNCNAVQPTWNAEVEQYNYYTTSY